MKRLIDVYVYRLKEGKPEFLLLLRSSKKIYAHQWRMIGGKVQQGEKYWEAALRELKEETAIIPEKFWVIPSINSFYEAKFDQVHHIPAFAVELNTDAIPQLNEEHTDYQWISIEDLDTYLNWPEQKRLIRLTNNLVVNDQILPEWLISIT